MGLSKISVSFSKSSVLTRLKGAGNAGLAEVSTELLKDANFYCRKDTGNLIESSLLASKPEKGVLVWDTPYAKKMYYVGAPVRDENPHASVMWAHRAAEEHRKKYEGILQKIFRKKV